MTLTEISPTTIFFVKIMHDCIGTPKTLFLWQKVRIPKRCEYWGWSEFFWFLVFFEILEPSRSSTFVLVVRDVNVVSLEPILQNGSRWNRSIALFSVVLARGLSCKFSAFQFHKYVHTSGVNILAQFMKFFPNIFRNFSAFPYKSFLISLFIKTFSLYL